MESYVIGAVGLIIGIVGAVAAFRGDVKVLTSRFETLIVTIGQQRETDKQVLDLRLNQIGTRVEDIARYIGVDRRKMDDGQEDV